MLNPNCNVQDGPWWSEQMFPDAFSPTLAPVEEEPPAASDEHADGVVSTYNDPDVFMQGMMHESKLKPCSTSRCEDRPASCEIEEHHHT